MRARDLFAGTGWSVACRTLGIEDHGVEWNEHARETRRINGLVTVGSDVRDVNGADGEYVLEIGSPPCERFTQTGHQDGSRARQEIIEAVDGMTDPGDIYAVIKSLDAHHEKVGLVLEPFRVLLENPHARAAVWEQVVTVLPIWEAVARKLRAWGWSVDTRNVNASWYGVPQDRRRAILLARRDGGANIPGQVESRVMRDVFPGREGWVQRSNYSAPSAYPGQTAQERGRTMRTLDQVSVTMTRKAAQWVHPDGLVTKMTVADMAAVQTFPEGMIFAGGIQDQRLQIGNAVPPLMAEALIRAALGLTLNSHACNVLSISRAHRTGEIEMGAIAAGKVNASEATEGMRIIVKVSYDSEGHATIRPSSTKTGEGVQVARIMVKDFRAAGRYEARGKYVIITSAGSFEAAPIQTMWLAPEDPAGIKRAHAEALELNKVYEVYPVAELDIETLPDPDGSNTLPVPPEFFQAEGAEDLTLNSHAGKAVDMEIEAVKKHTGSTVVALIERVWDRIRTEHPELPEVVVTTGSGEGVKWGHFRPESWKLAEDGRKLHEFFLSSEALAKGGVQVLQTTIHEAAHTLSKVRGVQDTSRQHRYHNGTFRKTAEELGLEHKASAPDKTHGFSFVTLTAATKEKYADLLAELEQELKLTGLLPWFLGGTDEEDEKGGEKITKPKGEGETKPNTNNVKCVCDCPEPNIIRMSRKVLAQQVVNCGDCDGLFHEAV